MNRMTIPLLVLILSALAVLLFLRIDGGPAADPPSMEQLIQQALQGRTAADKARQRLGSIIDEAPNAGSTLAARRQLADLEHSLDNHQAALDVLLDAMMAHPGDSNVPQLLHEAGLLLAGPLERPTEAAALFKRVVDLYPEHPLVPEAQVRLVLLQQDPDTARRLLAGMTRNTGEQP